MFTRIKTLTRTIALPAVVALGALAAVPATAQADSFYFGIGGGRHGPDVEFRFGDRGGRHWDRHGPRGCTAGQAVRKAERMGIRRAHVRGENRRVIRVAGRDRGRTVMVAFAKAPHCPVIR